MKIYSVTGVRNIITIISSVEKVLDGNPVNEVDELIKREDNTPLNEFLPVQTDQNDKVQLDLFYH